MGPPGHLPEAVVKLLEEALTIQPKDTKIPLLLVNTLVVLLVSPTGLERPAESPSHGTAASSSSLSPAETAAVAAAAAHVQSRVMALLEHWAKERGEASHQRQLVYQVGAMDHGSL